MVSKAYGKVGVATNNIALTAQQYSIFGYEVLTETIFDSIQNVYIAFMEKEGSPRVELVAPVNENSPILNTINKNGTIPYHFCYEVDNIVEEVKKMILVQEPKAFDKAPAKKKAVAKKVAVKKK